MELYFSLKDSIFIPFTNYYDDVSENYKCDKFLEQFISDIIERSNSFPNQRGINKESFKWLVIKDDRFNAFATRVFGNTRITLSNSFVQSGLPNRTDPQHLPDEKRLSKKRKREAVNTWNAVKKRMEAHSATRITKGTRDLLARYRFPIEKKWVKNLPDDPETLVEHLLEMPAEGRRAHLLGLQLLHNGKLLGGLSGIKGMLAHEAGHLRQIRQKRCFIPGKEAMFGASLTIMSALSLLFALVVREVCSGVLPHNPLVSTCVELGFGATAVCAVASIAFTGIAAVFALFQSSVQDDESSPMSWPERDADQQSLVHLAPKDSPAMLLNLKASAVSYLLQYMDTEQDSTQRMSATDHLRQFNVHFKNPTHGSPVTRWQAALKDCTNPAQVAD